MTGTTPERDERTVAIISAGISEPSSTRLLATRIADRVSRELQRDAVAVQFVHLDLAAFALDIARAVTGGLVSAKLKTAIQHIAAADAVIASTPVYKAGVSGLFKSFLDVLEDDLMLDKPTVLAATGGSARHSMVPDEQMRPLFAYMRALTVPTAVFAAPEDWSDVSLGRRIERAAVELAGILAADVATRIASENWDRHPHSFGAAVTPPRRGQGVSLDTPLMRLAAGGSLAGSD
jgi:FMN reductase